MAADLREYLLAERDHGGRRRQPSGRGAHFEPAVEGPARVAHPRGMEGSPLRRFPRRRVSAAVGGNVPDQSPGRGRTGVVARRLGRLRGATRFELGLREVDCRIGVEPQPVKRDRGHGSCSLVAR